MPNPVAEYEVKIVKSGSGGKEAAAELNAVEKAAKQVKQAFLALGGAAILRESLDAFVAQASALSRLKEISGATSEQMETLHATAEKLSTLMGRDLNRAVLALGQAMRGDFDMFKALGFTINDALSPTQQLNDLIVQIGARFTAHELSDPLLAEVDRAKKGIEDLKVALGEMIAFGIKGVTNLGASIGNAMGSKGSISAQRESVAGFIERQLATGKIGAKEADELRMQLSAGFATQSGARFGIPGNIAATTAEEQQAALDAVMGRLGGRGERTASPNTPAAISTSSLTKADEDKENLRYAAELVQKMKDEQALQVSLAQIEKDRQKGDLDFRHESRQLQDELTLLGLEGDDKLAAQMEIHHRQEIDHIDEIDNLTTAQHDRLMEQEEERYRFEKRTFAQAQSFAGKLNADFRQIGESGIQLFSQGLAGAMVDAFEKGGSAFKAFARNFLRTMAQMILQAVILRTIQSGLGGLGNLFGGGGGGGGGGLGSFAGGTGGGALSGIVPGGSAFTELSNVGAGHRSFVAGPGGGAGAGAGAGGLMVVHVSLQPGLTAAIVENSVNGAVAKVTEHVGQNTKLSRAVRRLST